MQSLQIVQKSMSKYRNKVRKIKLNSDVLTFRGIECIFGIWIDFNEKCVLLDKQVVHVEKSLWNQFGYIGQAKFFGYFNCLLFGQSLNNIDWLIENGIWILGSDFFNINTTLWRCNNYWTLSTQSENILVQLRPFLCGMAIWKNIHLGSKFKLTLNARSIITAM